MEFKNLKDLTEFNKFFKLKLINLIYLNTNNI